MQERIASEGVVLTRIEFNGMLSGELQSLFMVACVVVGLLGFLFGYSVLVFFEEFT
jgi:hypothetical protein